jgi:hypothetical protein
VTGVNGTNLSAAFVYDGDGKRVKSVIGSETILFVGGHYEKQGSNVTKYYFAGSQRIAVGKNGTLSYLLGDHLGSTSLSTDAAGNLLVETRYKPWGEVRYTTPNQTLPTRYTFTGQYSYVADDATDLGAVGFGLMYFGRGGWIRRWGDSHSRIRSFRRDRESRRGIGTDMPTTTPYYIRIRQVIVLTVSPQFFVRWRLAQRLAPWCRWLLMQ